MLAVKYVCLVYGEQQHLDSVKDSECRSWGESLRQNGKYVAAEALQPLEKAKTVRVRGGKPIVMDGPFTESKEYLAGFYLIEAADFEEAVRLASQIPPARIGTIEVRPVRELRP